MVGFIDDHRENFGVEPICAVLPIAPSRYELKARDRDPHRRPARARRDERLCEHVRRVWRENREVYGVRKVWKQLRREGQAVARCTVARLMRRLGLAGAVRGRQFRGDDDPGYRGGAPAGSGDATVHSRAAESAVGRRSDVRGHLARVRVRGVRIDVFSRRIVSWRTSTSLRSDLALDALEQALYDRPTSQAEPLVHHSDRGVQYLSIRYTERLAQAGIEPSVGSTGDSHDNALAESVIGLFKTEEIHRHGPWRGLEDVEFATLEWVAWYNGSRLLEPLGYVPPAEFEKAFAAGRSRCSGGAQQTSGCDCREEGRLVRLGGRRRGHEYEEQHHENHVRGRSPLSSLTPDFHRAVFNRRGNPGWRTIFDTRCWTAGISARAVCRHAAGSAPPSIGYRSSTVTHWPFEDRSSN